MQLSEVTLSGFPASASSEPLPVQSLAQLLAVRELQRHQPVISLRQALEQMGYVDAATLDRIQAENPDYLRSQSAELVRRMLAEDPFRTLRPQVFTGLLGAVESHSPQSETPAQQLTNGELLGPESRRLGAAQHFPTSSLASQSRPLLVSVAAGAPLSLRELEIRHIEQLLREHKNITMVAKLLDIDRRTLQRKLRGLGIEWRDE